MKKSFFIYLAAIFALVTSCTEDTTVMIRVKNSSSYNYQNLVIGGDNFGDLASGGYSGYKTYSSAYRYNSYRLIVENDTIRMIAIDYVGEKLLKSGKYTYEIDAVKNEDNTFSTTLTCVQD
ncbi:MAG: hypothetical protein PHR83_16175 [Paludibacter sp.]|nr:hypothetical protein [Paludibacter sp.]